MASVKESSLAKVPDLVEEAGSGLRLVLHTSYCELILVVLISYLQRRGRSLLMFDMFLLCVVLILH